MTGPTHPFDDRSATADAPTPMERAEALIAQGNELEDRGNLESALARYREASGIAPDFARAWVNIGNALQAMGKLHEAIAAQKTALRLVPDLPAAHYNLGSLLAAVNAPTEAERELREALRIKPDMTDAALVLAEVLETHGRGNEAEALLRGVLEQHPNAAMAALNLALLLLARERFDESEAVLVRARTMNPGVAPLSALLGSICVKLGRSREAGPLFLEALAAPQDLFDTASAYLFSLNYRDDLDAETVFREHRRLGALIDSSAGAAPAGFGNPPDPDRRLRIGYVSGDFRQHPVALMMRPVLERHDNGRFDVHCYANHRDDDDLTRMLKGLAPNWRSIFGMDDSTVVEGIQRDGIDILVDLSGHTAHSRLPVFSRRAAPVQATWLGYLNTTGLGTIDYRLCDRYTDPPPATEHLYTEQLARLPHSQWCFEPVYSIPVTDRPHPEAPDALIFGSFNQFAKISDASLALWCSVLATLPAAQLRVHGVPEGRTRSAFLERLSRNGLDSARVSLSGRVGILEYFRAIGEVDIALDTFPYSGGTTTLDTLWLGVPLVALDGSRAIARSSFSINSSLGVPELLATTPAEYVEKNVRLAKDAALRRDLRQSLRGRLQSSPLMDKTGFVADLERIYRDMWRTWCRQRADAPSAV